MAKLKIFKDFIFFVIAAIVLDFIISKVFKINFSIYETISTAICGYIGYYLVTRKK